MRTKRRVLIDRYNRRDANPVLCSKVSRNGGIVEGPGTGRGRIASALQHRSRLGMPLTGPQCLRTNFALETALHGHHKPPPDDTVPQRRDTPNGSEIGSDIEGNPFAHHEVPTGQSLEGWRRSLRKPILLEGSTPCHHRDDLSAVEAWSDSAEHIIDPCRPRPRRRANASRRSPIPTVNRGARSRWAAASESPMPAQGTRAILPERPASAS